nr:hypothetical protein [Halomicroarcula sp. SHR3]
MAPELCLSGPDDAAVTGGCKFVTIFATRGGELRQFVTATSKCRIHGGDLYPDACNTYPGENLLLATETECERVEAVHGGRRLLDDEPPDVSPLFGPGAVGERVFAHPDPDRVTGRIERFRDGELTREDRAEFVAVAAASSPGTLAVNDDRYEQALERILRADSWVGRAIDRWGGAADAVGERAADAPEPGDVEDGAPPTPGW